MKKKNILKVGSFYLIYGGQPHPAKIIKYDPKHKTYLSYKFGTTNGKHMTKIHSLQKDNKEQYVHNRPFEGTRKDYGDKELFGLAVDERDCEILANIKNKNPVKTSSAKKRYRK